MEIWKILLSVTVAALAFVYRGGEPPRRIEPLNPDDPERLPENVTKRVLIIGGGLAGLSAGLELTERGYNVTIKEKNHVLGGRLMTEEIDVDGQTFHIEHGFHGWFNNYHNMKDIRSRLGVNDYFRPWVENHFMYRDYELEEIHSVGPFPLNLLYLSIKSPNLSVVKLLANPVIAIMNFFFDYETVYEKYDNMTFEEWEDYHQVNEAFSDIFLKPALSVTFNENEVFSAAEMLTFSHIFFMSDDKADLREITIVDHATALVNPLADRIKHLGGKILTDSPVKALQINTTNSAVTREINDVNSQYDHVILATDLPATQMILSASVEEQPKMAAFATLWSDVDKLPIAPPYKVIRVWFDKQLRDSVSYDVLQTSQHHPVVLIIQYNLLEQEYIEWAERTGGSVFEFHAYTWQNPGTPDNEVWDMITPTVQEIYPEIFERGFRILGYHVYSGQNFASFRSGLRRYRPSSGHPILCGVPNLVFAGDWLHTDYPSALMERAVSTGREAANHILLADHVKQVPLVVTSSRGPGII